jgi:hypothetical protein
MTVEESWFEITTMGRLAGWRWWHRFTRRRQWAVVEVEEAPDGR